MDEPVLDDRTFDAIGELMHREIGLSLAPNRMTMVASRLAPRLTRLGLPGYGDWLARVERDDLELQIAVDLLTTNETYFFREPEHFALLEREWTAAPPAAPRIWSAACSFGDEPYALAILLSEMQAAGRLPADWRVLGTDVSDRALRAAVEGVFPIERLRHVSPARLRRWFLKGEGDSEGSAMLRGEGLRERVSFGQLNLMAPLDEVGPFDAIFLRNVLIYFDAPTKRDVVERVASRLRPGGLLFIGMAEGRLPGAAPLDPIAPGAYRVRS